MARIEPMSGRRESVHLVTQEAEFSRGSAMERIGDPTITPVAAHPHTSGGPYRES